MDRTKAGDFSRRPSHRVVLGSSTSITMREACLEPCIVSRMRGFQRHVSSAHFRQHGHARRDPSMSPQVRVAI
jgi:hypothetical protein